MDIIAKINSRMKEAEKNLHIHDFPDNVIIEIATFCNLKCVQCRHDLMTREKGKMPLSVCKKIIDEVACKNPEAHFWICGFGEPLFVPYQLYYVIKYAKKHGLKNVFLDTNATLLNEDTAELLIESGIDKIVFSVDGFSADIYERIRRGANRDKVYGNILYFSKLNNKLNSPIDIECQFIIMDENEHEIEEYCNFWKNQGIKVKIRKKIGWIEGVTSEPHSDNLERIACGWGVNTCPITFDGNVVNCGADMNGDHIWGNVLKNTIEEIWNGERKVFVQNQLEHRWNLLPKICQDCHDWHAIGTVDFDENGIEYQKKHR